MAARRSHPGMPPPACVWAHLAPCTFCGSFISARLICHGGAARYCFLGEFSALVANKCLSFEDALKLVYKRALAMQKACEINPSTMAVIENNFLDIVNPLSWSNLDLVGHGGWSRCGLRRGTKLRIDLVFGTPRTSLAWNSRHLSGNWRGLDRRRWRLRW